jgi:hypothetical protein
MPRTSSRPKSRPAVYVELYALLTSDAFYSSFLNNLTARRLLVLASLPRSLPQRKSEFVFLLFNIFIYRFYDFSRSLAGGSASQKSNREIVSMDLEK